MECPCLHTLPAFFLGEDRKFQMHAFMVFTADNRTDGFVLARLIRRGKQKFLRARLEEQVPPIDFAVILGAQEREAVNRSVTIPRFTLARGDPKDELFSRLY